MKKITRDSAVSFYLNKNFKRGNTQVTTDGITTELLLHGNRIASKLVSSPFLSLSIDTCGFNTQATRARLRAISPVPIIYKNKTLLIGNKPWDGKAIHLHILIYS